MNKLKPKHLVVVVLYALAEMQMGKAARRYMTGFTIYRGLHIA